MIVVGAVLATLGVAIQVVLAGIRYAQAEAPTYADGSRDAVKRVHRNFAIEYAVCGVLVVGGTWISAIASISTL